MSCGLPRYCSREVSTPAEEETLIWLTRSAGAAICTVRDSLSAESLPESPKEETPDFSTISTKPRSLLSDILLFVAGLNNLQSQPKL